VAAAFADDGRLPLAQNNKTEKYIPKMRKIMPPLATSANEAPRLAYETAKGPALITAGPGPRKTTTLVERAVDLIQNHGAAPESLLIVTFSDAAAREFSTRIRNRLNSQGIKFNLNVMYAGTFHSLCLRLLDEHREFTRMKRNYTVMDPFDQHYFIYQRLKEYRALADCELVMGKDASRWNQAQNLLKRLNAVTEQALDAKDLAAASQQREGRTLAACYKLYLQQLTKANALDFSTIQLEALRLLENNPEVLALLRNQLAYLMVDDEQNTSTIIQERIFRCLLNGRPGPSSAGNAEQGHYRFRGAAGENIIEFPNQFEERFKQLGRPPQTETIPWWLM
jgi:DNA helicase-2/ATP-dependent DNA helicase PcrA